MQSITEQLVQLKNRYFAQWSNGPEVGAALDAQPPEDEERAIRDARRKNQRYGRDPKSIERYSRRFPKLPAVFEAGE